MNAHPAPTGMLARAVREAVECFASPDVTLDIVASALELAGRSEVPEAGRTVMVFVENALFAAVEDRLDTETAMMIVDQLRPIASMASAQEVSEVRPTTPPLGLFQAAPDEEQNRRITARPATPALVLDMSEDEEHDDEPELEIGPIDALDDLDDLDDLAGLDFDLSSPLPEEVPRTTTPTMPPSAEAVRTRDEFASQRGRRPPSAPRRRAQWTEPEPELLRVVLVCTSDPMRAAGMGRAMAGLARVQPVADALAILSEPADLLVVDCLRPTVRLETLLSVVPELADSCRVVLWGEAPDFRKQLGIVGGAIPDNWLSCGPDADAEDVATVCRVLLE